MSRFHDPSEKPQEEGMDEGELIASEITINRQKEEYAEQVKRLAKKAAECTLKYGEDHYLTETMVMFLEMALEMQNAIDMITTAQVAISTIQKAIGVVRNSLNFNSMVMQNISSQNMGFFARLKRRREMRKATRNAVNSITTSFEEIMGFSKMSQEMVVALQEVMDKMHRSTAKAKRRRQKMQERKEKRKVKEGVALGPSPAKALIDEAIAELKGEGGFEGGAAPAAGGVAGGTPGGGSKTLKSKGIDNIDDITGDV